MPEIYVKKLGQSCTIYQDERGQSIPFSDVENPPEFYSMIQTMSYRELLQTFPKGTKFNFVEPKAKPESPGTPLNRTVLRSQMEAMGIASEEIERMCKAPPEASRGIVVPTSENLNPKQEPEMDKVLTEFRILLAKYAANPQNPQVKQEVSAVGSFLLSVWPELEPELLKLKESATKPRFSL